MREDIQCYNCALDRAKEGEWQQAETLLIVATRLASKEAEYYSLLGVVYLGLRNRSLAIEHFRIAYSLNLHDPLLQTYIPLIALNDIDDSFPPDANVRIPRKPKPSAPGYEADSDEGMSQIP
ncbi:hypothetical protein H6F43_09475 [Leptolyngbya sp. FACHB-36]|nr:hypothetical protein [Leptolyngbya sp. FACHB-36]